MNRRQALSLIAGTTAAATAANGLGAGATAIAQTQPAPAGPFRLPPLGYGYDALEPHIDTTTMLIHHDYHHAAYVNACKRPPGHRRKIETNMAIGAKPA